MVKFNYKNYTEYKNNRKKINFKYINNNNNNYHDFNFNIKIAIIIPHRNRIQHLIKFVDHLNNLNNVSGLTNRIDIYVIDQNNGDKFNRGLLLNIGYLISKKLLDYDRYIFHDVDSYPDYNIFQLYFTHINYNIHYASPYLDYKYTFDDFFGGIISFCKNDFEKINGFPNNFFGWGGEDDALYNRVSMNNIDIYRPTIGKYTLIEHDKPTKAEYNKSKQKNILEDLKQYKFNGLKQLLNIFINLKYFDNLDNFIETYEKLDSNIDNGAELLNLYFDKINNNSDKIMIHKSSKQFNNINYYIFKIDYLALHTPYFDRFLNKNYVNDLIKKKIDLFKNDKYYQHNKYKQIISYIEPLTEWDEIKSKIIDTYTSPKKFTNNLILNNKSEIKIKKLVSKNFLAHNVNTNLKSEDLFDTLKIIYNTFNELLYFRIRNNEIVCSYHIYNFKNNIDWLKYIKYQSNPDTQPVNFDSSISILMDNIKKDYYTLRKPHYISSNNCLLSLESYLYFEGNPISYVKTFKEMLDFTINKFGNIPDCDILINRKDFPFFEKNNKFAYEHLLSNDQNNIQDYYTFNKIFFIGSQSVKSNHMDIPIPSADEWNDINKYDNITNTINNIKWKNKIPIGFFRGSSTGCGQNINNNQRLKLSNLSYEWYKQSNKKNLLNVAISYLVLRPRAYYQLVGYSDRNKYKYLLGSFVDLHEQLKFKYIFNIQGNAQAYRYSNEFKKKSLILSVESDYKMWFEPLIKNNKHYVAIDKNYNNLFEKLTYLKLNDDIAKQIAINGYKFSHRYITKDMIALYWYFYMINININYKL